MCRLLCNLVCKCYMWGSPMCHHSSEDQHLFKRASLIMEIDLLMLMSFCVLPHYFPTGGLEAHGICCIVWRGVLVLVDMWLSLVNYADME